MAYNYYMNKSGSDYRILDANLNVIAPSVSTSSSVTFAYLNNNLLANGSNIDVQAGAYTVNGIWRLTINNVTITFELGANLTAVPNNNQPIFYFQSVSGCTIIGGSFDGNRLNQTANCQVIWLINCTNCLVNGATITNARTFGYVAQGVTINCGIINSTVSYCMWNGISLGFLATETNLYALNNTVSHCADVGISSYGIDSVITDNKIHDMEAIGIPNDHAGVNAMWGIACEGGGGSGGKYLTIERNTVTNCTTGVCISASGSGPVNYILISNNTLTNMSSVVYAAIHLEDSSFSIVKSNSVTTAVVGLGIYNGNGSSVKNTIYPNTFNNCTTKIVDKGTDTIYPTPALPLPFHDPFTNPALPNWTMQNGTWKV